MTSRVEQLAPYMFQERWVNYVNHYPRWDTIIAIEDRKAFLDEEKLYCKTELDKFNKYDWHAKPEPPDSVRKAVLDKRTEFLKMVVRNDMFHFKPTAELHKLR